LCAHTLGFWTVVPSPAAPDRRRGFMASVMPW
jgi:hypothetical protein